MNGLMGLALASAALASGPFVAPAEGPVPFRRDRLPLDVDTMNGLSRHILLMTKKLTMESTLERRTAAQAIALALALDPTNRDARDLAAQLVEERTPTAPEDAEVESSRAKVWQLHGWLESSESGQDGQALGGCLTDVMSVLDPSHPKSQAHHGKGDSGEWTGWVPVLASFDEPEKVKTPDPELVEPTNPLDPVTPELRRTEAVVSTPLWTYDKVADKTVLKPMKISMKASTEGNHGGGGQGSGQEPDKHPKFNFILEGTQDADQLRQTSMSIVTALKQLEDHMPAGANISLTVGKGDDYLVQKNRQSISAAAAVLGDAAISGREPAATVMGVVGDDGSLKLPARAWDRLRALSDGPGGRLVLPREAEALLPSILAMEDPAFFMKYEVVLADNLKELVEFSAKGGQGPLADASTRFAEIREKMGAMPVAQYVANRFIRQRLSEISQSCPDHLSARMLSIQGAGERPTRLPKSILASEIRRAIEPIGAIVHEWDQNLDVSVVDQAFEGSRGALDPLERYVDIQDRDFFGEARDLLTTVRTFARAKRSRDNFDQANSHSAQQVFDSLKAQYATLRAELADISGDEDPKDLGGKMRQDKPLDRFKGLK